MITWGSTVDPWNERSGVDDADAPWLAPLVAVHLGVGPLPRVRAILAGPAGRRPHGSSDTAAPHLLPWPAAPLKPLVAAYIGWTQRREMRDMAALIAAEEDGVLRR